jgi:hypothetical protein
MGRGCPVIYAQYVDEKPAANDRGIELEPDSEFLGIEIADVQCEEADDAAIGEQLTKDDQR